MKIAITLLMLTLIYSNQTSSTNPSIDKCLDLGCKRIKYTNSLRDCYCACAVFTMWGSKSNNYEKYCSEFRKNK